MLISIKIHEYQDVESEIEYNKIRTFTHFF